MKLKKSWKIELFLFAIINKLKTSSLWSCNDQFKKLPWKISYKSLIFDLSKFFDSWFNDDDFPFFQIKVITFYWITILQYLSILCDLNLILKEIYSIYYKSAGKIIIQIFFKDLILFMSSYSNFWFLSFSYSRILWDFLSLKSLGLFDWYFLIIVNWFNIDFAFSILITIYLIWTNCQIVNNSFLSIF